MLHLSSQMVDVRTGCDEMQTPTSHHTLVPIGPVQRMDETLRHPSQFSHRQQRLNAVRV